MKSLKNILAGSVVSLMLCGIASASPIVQTFSLPAADAPNTFNWTATGLVNSYSYYQNLSPSTYGVLTDATVIVTWNSVSAGGGRDSSTGTEGTDYLWSAVTTMILKGNSGSGVSFVDSDLCQDTSFTNKHAGDSFSEPGCLDSNVISGNPLTNTYTSGAGYNYFVGSGASAGTIALNGTANLIANFSGGPFDNGSVGGHATMNVSVIYDYSAPVPPSSTPEPTTMVLMGTALVGTGLLRKRLKKS